MSSELKTEDFFMKKLIAFLVTFTLVITANARNLLKYENVVDISNYKGQTFFSLMLNEIKPALDHVAENGFQIANGNKVLASLKYVDKKVAGKALRAAGSKERLKQLADDLSKNYNELSFYDLPDAIAKAGFKQGRYDLSTFLALVSGGGVGVKIDNNNIAYNVNYGTGEYEKDEMTGRSFGEAPKRFALDASDKHYLSILENYVRSESTNTQHFYSAILHILLNNDTSEYSLISENGQAVATDFLAVYTAEQTRHLMADLKNHHWDEALLEVTLLSAFHAGQKDIMVMYDGELTSTTHQQTPGCNENEKRSKKASMIDYWQFSTSTDPANCNRSGINITRRDFRALGAAITEYQRIANPELVANIESLLGLRKESKNLFADLSKFLINYKTAHSLDSQTLTLAEEFTYFLMQTQQHANKLSKVILEKQNK